MSSCAERVMQKFWFLDCTTLHRSGNKLWPAKSFFVASSTVNKIKKRREQCFHYFLTFSPSLKNICLIGRLNYTCCSRVLLVWTVAGILNVRFEPLLHDKDIYTTAPQHKKSPMRAPIFYLDMKSLLHTDKTKQICPGRFTFFSCNFFFSF